MDFDRRVCFEERDGEGAARVSRAQVMDYRPGVRPLRPLRRFESSEIVGDLDENMFALSSFSALSQRALQQ